MENKETKVMEFDTVDYDFEEVIGDEENALDEVTGNYGAGIDLATIVHEVADSNTPVYYGDIWEHAPEIEPYANDAKEEGLIDPSADIVDQLQAGYFFLYNQVLNENLDKLVYNMVMERINEHLYMLEEEDCPNSEEAEEIEAEVESFSEDADLNTNTQEIEDKATELLEEYGLLKEEE